MLLLRGTRTQRCCDRSLTLPVPGTSCPIIRHLVVYRLATDNGSPTGAGASKGRVVSGASAPFPAASAMDHRRPCTPPTVRPCLQRSRVSRMARASALLGLLRGSETVSLGWWHPVFVSRVMQQQPREFPRSSCLLWTAAAVTTLKVSGPTGHEGTQAIGSPTCSASLMERSTGCTGGGKSTTPTGKVGISECYPFHTAWGAWGIPGSYRGRTSRSLDHIPSPGVVTPTSCITHPESARPDRQPPRGRAVRP